MNSKPFSLEIRNKGITHIFFYILSLLKASVQTLLEENCNGYGACFGLGTLDWGSHSSLWVPWGRGSLRELCSPVHYLSWWFSVYDMIFMKFSCHFFFFFFLLLLSSILQWLLIICKLCNLIDCETIKHIIKIKKRKENCNIFNQILHYSNEFNKFIICHHKLSFHFTMTLIVLRPPECFANVSYCL